MQPDISRLRQQLLQTEESRADSVEAILGEQGPFRSGSLVTVVRKCGKPTCHCATGHGHPAVYLSTKQGGKTRMVYVPADCVESVTQHAQGYRRLRTHRARLAKLAQESLRIIDSLQEALSAEQPMRTKGGRNDNGRRSKPGRKRS
jgi:hypothetical protein